MNYLKKRRLYLIFNLVFLSIVLTMIGIVIFNLKYLNPGAYAALTLALIGGLWVPVHGIIIWWRGKPKKSKTTKVTLTKDGVTILEYMTIIIITLSITACTTSRYGCPQPPEAKYKKR